MSIQLKNQFFDIKKEEEININTDDLLSKHLLITGVTCSGKSTTALSILMSMKREKQNVIIIDPTGEFKDVPNQNRLVLGRDSYLDIQNLSSNHLANLLNIKNETLLEKLPVAIKSLQIQKSVKNAKGTYTKLNKPRTEYIQDLNKLECTDKAFNISNLPDQFIEEFILPNKDSSSDFSLLGQSYDTEIISAVWSDIENLRVVLSDNNFMNIITRNKDSKLVHYDVDYLINLFVLHRALKKNLLIDVSLFASNKLLGATIVNILVQSILNYRQKNRLDFPVLLFIDEAHRYLTPKKRDGIFSVLREGRKSGVNLMLSTQSPLDLDEESLSQFSSKIVHQLQTNKEIESLNMKLISPKTKTLKVGEAILKVSDFDDYKLIKIKQCDVKHHSGTINYT